MGFAAGLGLAFTGASTAVDIYGQKKAAGAQRRQDIMAQAIGRQNAQDAITRGSNLVARTLGEGGRTAGAARASVAGRGFDIGVGTAQDVNNAIDLMSSIDALTIRENARQEAKGYMTDSYNAGVAASNVSAKGGIAGSFLSGASSVAAQWYSRKARTAKPLMEGA